MISVPQKDPKGKFLPRMMNGHLILGILTFPSRRAHCMEMASLETGAPAEIQPDILNLPTFPHPNPERPMILPGLQTELSEPLPAAQGVTPSSPSNP